MSRTARFQWCAVSRSLSIALLFTAAVFGIANPAVSASSEHPLAENSRRARATLQVELLVEPDRASISVDPTISEIVSLALLSGSARVAGSAQARTFDASDVIPGSAKLEPSNTAVVGSPILEDVDGDGDLDLLLAFSLETANLPCGPGDAIVSAKTELGEAISAHGRIVVRGCLGGGNGVVDFESLGIAPGSQIDVPDNAAQQVLGFLFAPGPNNESELLDSHYGNAQPGWGYNGTTVAGLHDDIVMTRTDGGTFTLLGFDLSGFPFDEEVPFTVESSDGTIAEFEVDGMVDGIGGVEDFESFEAPPSGFIDVTSVVWEHFGGGTNKGTFHLDNIHYVRDCDLVIRLETPLVRPGENLEGSLYLHHNRNSVVTVPFVLWVEDESGNVRAHKTLPARTFSLGDEYERRFEVPIPRDALDCDCRLVVGTEGMQQGEVRAEKLFRIEH